MPGDADFRSLEESSEADAAAERAGFEAEVARRRYLSKKRPDRTPFNPLPETYDDDEEVDLPPEAFFDRTTFEELTDEEQMRVRTHQGLIRLRRNEQKLQRLLQMEKPDRLDLLMLLNELELLQGKEREMHEKYIGPKVDFEQLDSDLNYVHSWSGMEYEDDPDIISSLNLPVEEKKARAEGENSEGEEGEKVGKAEQKRKEGSKGLPFVTLEAVWEAEHRRKLKEFSDRKRLATELDDRDAEFEREDPTRVRLLKLHEELMRDRAKSVSRPQYEEPLMKDEAEAAQLHSLRRQFPDGYEKKYRDDEVFDSVAEKDLAWEVDLLTSKVDSSLRLRRDTRDAKAKQKSAERRAELRKDPTVQGVIDDEKTLDLLNKKGPFSAEERQSLHDAHAKADAEAAVLKEYSSIWRIKQETIARWRTAIEEAGGKMDEEMVAEFMAEDDEGLEAELREFDEMSENSALEEEMLLDKAAVKIRRQKKWLAEMREAVGGDKVKELVKSRAIHLKTFGGLRAVLEKDTELINRQGMAATTKLRASLESLGTRLADIFGLTAEEVKRLQAGDETVEMPTGDALIQRREQRRLEREKEDGARFLRDTSLTQRHLAEANAAQARGDSLAARKLRLMNARLLEWERSSRDSKRQQSSKNKAQLQRAGRALSGDDRGQREYPIQQAKFGRVTAEELRVNRELIARGDGANPNFVDSDVSHEGVDLVPKPPAILFPASTFRVRAEGRSAAADTEAAAREADLPSGPGVFKAHNAAVLAYSRMTEEQKFALSEEREKENAAEFEEFDDYVLSRIPLKLHEKAVRQWKLLSEADRRKVIREGRENRDDLMGWMAMRTATISEEGQDVDPLSQYLIDEADPKIFGAIEGAFWHVGRWGLDERTPEQRAEGMKRRIATRFRPDMPDTQQLLDAIEADIFRDSELTEEEIDSRRDLTAEDKRIYKQSLRENQEQHSPPSRLVEVEVKGDMEERRGAAAQSLIEAERNPKGGAEGRSVSHSNGVLEEDEEVDVEEEDVEEARMESGMGRGRRSNRPSRFGVLDERQLDPDIAGRFNKTERNESDSEEEVDEEVTRTRMQRSRS